MGLIIGAILGASIGFGAAAYVDYKDDGQIFNGSVAWYDYIGATLLGGAIGAGLGAGVIIGIDNGKLKIKFDPIGFFGFELSIDFGRIFRDIF